jgi:signal transduction histidine kinase
LLEAFVQQARAYVLARTVTLQCSEVPLLPICLAAVGATTARAQQRGIKIVQDIEPNAPRVWGETTAIRRILDNLLTNAVGVTPAGGEVLLSITQPTSALIEIVVQDHGPGIPVEKQVKIFEPYISLQLATLDSLDNRSPSPTGTGMGLGLAIVKELTTTLGGTCGVTSEPGAGSAFYVRLPVALEGGEHDHRAGD